MPPPCPIENSSRYSDVAQIAQSLLHNTLFGLVHLGCVVAEQFAQQKRQQLLQVAEARGVSPLRLAAEFSGQTHLTQFARHQALTMPRTRDQSARAMRRSSSSKPIASATETKTR